MVMTKEEIIGKAQEITKGLSEDLMGFIQETDCVITEINITTEEEPIGQTGLVTYKQTIDTKVGAPADHPAFKEGA